MYFDSIATLVAGMKARIFYRLINTAFKLCWARAHGNWFFFSGKKETVEWGNELIPSCWSLSFFARCPADLWMKTTCQSCRPASSTRWPRWLLCMCDLMEFVFCRGVPMLSAGAECLLGCPAYWARLSEKMHIVKALCASWAEAAQNARATSPVDTPACA